MIINVTFETRAGDPNDGYIVIYFEDEDGVALASFNVDAAVTSPTGAFLRELGAPENFGPGGNATILVPIPLDSDGAYLKGTYIIDLQHDNATNPGGPDYFQTFNYDYCPWNSPDHTTSELITFGMTLDCVAETLTLEDKTAYGDVVVDLRSMIFRPPLIANTAAVTTAATLLTQPVTWTNATYEGELNVEYSDNEVVSGIVTIITMGSVELYEEVLVDCDPSMCATVKCLGAKFSALKTQAKKAGGWHALPQEDLANYYYGQTLVNLATLSSNCGDKTQAKAYLDEAKLELNCDCSCVDITKPAPL